MTLQEIELPASSVSLPPEVENFLAVAHRYTETFYGEQLGLRYPKYVPSDAALFYTSLTYLQNEGLLQGNRFCEWGSGFGIACGVAALCGMDAVGLELETELVARSRDLLTECDLSVEILNLSYFPEGFDESEGHGGKDLIIPPHASGGPYVGSPQYDGLDPEEVDVFYVYPYPDQEEMMQDLFETIATPGAILLMYLGDSEMAAFTHED